MIATLDHKIPKREKLRCTQAPKQEFYRLYKLYKFSSSPIYKPIDDNFWLESHLSFASAYMGDWQCLSDAREILEHGDKHKVAGSDTITLEDYEYLKLDIKDAMSGKDMSY